MAFHKHAYIALCDAETVGIETAEGIGRDNTCTGRLCCREGIDTSITILCHVQLWNSMSVIKAMPEGFQLPFKKNNIVQVGVDDVPHAVAEGEDHLFLNVNTFASVDAEVG